MLVPQSVTAAEMDMSTSGMLRASTFLVTLLGFSSALGTVSVTYQGDSLVADISGVPTGSFLQLVLLRPDAIGCADSEAVTVVETEPITAENMTMSFPAGTLHPGSYCAVVLSLSGNFTSEQPAKVEKQNSDDRGNGIRDKGPACRNWNATVIVQGSYAQSITASVNLFEDKTPQCGQLRVGLWEVMSSEGDQSTPCLTGIIFAGEKTKTVANLSVVVLFENLTAGNYCVRVTPVCDLSEDCLTLTSKVIQLFSAQTGPRSQMSEAAAQSRLLWLLLLPLLLGAAAVIVLAAFWVRRQSWMARNKLFILGSPPPVCRKPQMNPGPPVVKVVYSRDSEPHVAAVTQLCELLRRELGVRVEWDEAAVGHAHVTHDWAMAMAQLPCPHFNPSAMATATAPVKMLVLESDGALLKHQAYRRHKDLGQASESNIDELYHTTYAALLSNHAQALGDYCHIAVARLPYTTLPDRLDLVPEKRYLLPQHLQPLLEALLHGTTLPESRADLALRSDACSRFTSALANAGNTHEERGFAEDSVCGKLRSMLLATQA
ncbi:uncharacterized protein LOC142592536 isoform X2 [Dermacentor variabilis]|uniref:uncharacterized protein LOC142592536 isoform X2 n=1 Tax=Dermacentor variabilis TaxID=34621 RepID=UPI003F5C6F74